MSKLLIFTALFGMPLLLQACTNFLVTKGATVEGINTITYNADASNFYGTIYHYPAAKHDSNTETRQMWSWE